MITVYFLIAALLFTSFVLGNFTYKEAIIFSLIWPTYSILFVLGLAIWINGIVVHNYYKKHK